MRGCGTLEFRWKRGRGALEARSMRARNEQGRAGCTMDARHRCAGWARYHGSTAHAATPPSTSTARPRSASRTSLRRQQGQAPKLGPLPPAHNEERLMACFTKLAIVFIIIRVGVIVMVKRREVIRFLKNHGFVNEGGTNHDRYQHPDGRWTVVERHQEIRNKTFDDIKKQIRLK
ncbi:type II toxin-antitoxin system HicA family toxin [Eggerthella sinensis]|uniref:type II toxin-antitoxin system HicA family toxin n=2 Tax=Eggerthella sinensis TaxID=242230 RepID=UPI0029CA04DE|nr:type II toxin-antitoxin system HicA family toxin [Eggerthella sinensis]